MYTQPGLWRSLCRFGPSNNPALKEARVQPGGIRFRIQPDVCDSSPRRELRGASMDITFLKDIELVRLRPHAHIRGKSARYTVTYPDGREEIVLNVPGYD